MTTESMGKGIILTKDILRKMGQKKKSETSSKGGQILTYTSERLDPKNHVRFGHTRFG